MKSSTDIQANFVSQVSEQILKDTDIMLKDVNKSVPVFFTKMDPCYFFDVGNATSRKPIGVLTNTIVLCVSAIGSANSFAKGIERVSFSPLVVSLNWCAYIYVNKIVLVSFVELNFNCIFWEV